MIGLGFFGGRLRQLKGALKGRLRGGVLTPRSLEFAEQHLKVASFWLEFHCGFELGHSRGELVLSLEHLRDLEPRRCLLRRGAVSLRQPLQGAGCIRFPPLPEIETGEGKQRIVATARGIGGEMLFDQIGEPVLFVKLERFAAN